MATQTLTYDTVATAIGLTDGGPVATASGAPAWFVPATEWLLTAPSAAGVAQTPANEVRVFRFYLPFPLIITKLVWNLVTGAVNGLMAVGLYDSNGNKLVAADAVVSTAAAQGVQSITVSTTTFTVGMYYLAWSTNNTSIAYGGSTVGNAVWSVVLNGGTAQFGSAANAMVAGALPATLGTITALSAVNNMIFAKLQG